MKRKIKNLLCVIPLLGMIIWYGCMLHTADTNMKAYAENYTPITESHYSPWYDDRYIICEVYRCEEDWVVNSNDTILHVIMPDGSIQMYAIEDDETEEITEVLFDPNGDEYADYEIVDVR